MKAQHSRSAALQAEAGVIETLERIDSARVPMDQARADLLLARIAWSRITEPGDSTAGMLLSTVGATAALELLVHGVNAKELVELAKESGVELRSRTAKEALDRWLPRLSRTATIGDIDQADTEGIQVVLPGDTLWPVAVNDLAFHAPNMLWVKGNPQHLAAQSLGVVGARAATGYGSHVTAEIVDGVCAAGIAIISGAAYGIDAVAHRTALAAESPTIAMVAGGVDRPYPKAHESLFNRISATGAVCAEMVPGSAPTKWRFLQRNRLIAALSGAILVAEAGVRSGSINTAGHAAQLGRPIGAVPGPTTSAASAGCHRLIREYDATLVTNAKEACELIGVHDQLALFGGESTDERDGAWERRVRDALPLRGARDLAEIATESGLTTEQTRGVLTELELLGIVRRQDSPAWEPQKWSLQKPPSP